MSLTKIAAEQFAEKSTFITVGGGGTMLVGGISASTIVSILGGAAVLIGLYFQLIKSLRDKDRRNDERQKRQEERELHEIEMQIKRKQLNKDLLT